MNALVLLCFRQEFGLLRDNDGSNGQYGQINIRARSFTSENECIP